MMSLIALPMTRAVPTITMRRVCTTSREVVVMKVLGYMRMVGGYAKSHDFSHDDSDSHYDAHTRSHSESY